jgi:hypothetical protein
LIFSRVPLKAKGGIVADHAAAVVGDLDELPPASI